jgi:hypothetical protein
MPKKTIDYAIDIMQYLKQSGNDEFVTGAVLVRAIRMIAGDIKHVRERHKQFLIDMGFIKFDREDHGEVIYKLNYELMYRMVV